jgi:hypothetical protein
MSGKYLCVSFCGAGSWGWKWEKETLPQIESNGFQLPYENKRMGLVGREQILTQVGICKYLQWEKSPTEI